MRDGVRARCTYGGLELTCDAEALARLHAHLCAEPSVAEAIIGLPGASSANRFIRVVPPPADDPAPHRITWLNVLCAVLAVALTGVPQIVGYVTIYRWLFG